MASGILDSSQVQRLARVVEESTRSTREGVKFFIEPAPGTLSRAKNKRHHIIFGRRGSGKSSLLAKVSEDLTIERTPIAYVDLEEFKGHSYPDVLLSVLIKALNEFRKWLGTAAISPATKTSFWRKFFGSKPKRPAFHRESTLAITQTLEELIEELNKSLFQADEAKRQITTKSERGDELKTAISVGTSQTVPIAARTELSASAQERTGVEEKVEYASQKIELLHRNIMRFKDVFARITELAGGPTFLLLDDLYHIRLADQAQLLDYFHRIAKGSNLWIKVGTIRHRSRWYVFGNPPYGMKLGDDAEEIDLDVTLENMT